MLENKLIAFNLNQASAEALPTLAQLAESGSATAQELRLAGVAMVTKTLETEIEGGRLEALFERLMPKEEPAAPPTPPGLDAFKEKLRIFPIESFLESTSLPRAATFLAEAVAYFEIEKENRGDLLALLSISLSTRPAQRGTPAAQWTNRARAARGLGKIGEELALENLGRALEEERHEKAKIAMQLAQIEILSRLYEQDENIDAYNKITNIQTEYPKVQAVIDMFIVKHTAPTLSKNSLLTQAFGGTRESAILSKLREIGTVEDIDVILDIFPVNPERPKPNDIIRRPGRISSSAPVLVMAAEAVMEIWYREYDGNFPYRGYLEHVAPNTLPILYAAQARIKTDKGTKADLPKLKKHLRIKLPLLRTAAAKAIAAIHVRAGNVGALRRMLWSWPLSNKYERIAAAEAIGEVGNRRDVWKLKLMVRSRDEELVRAAARSLGKLGMPKDLPRVPAFGGHFFIRVVTRLYLNDELTKETRQTLCEAVANIFARAEREESLYQMASTENNRNPLAAKAATYGLVKYFAAKGELEENLDEIMGFDYGIAALLDHFRAEQGDPSYA
ncbi:MAG: HEAT repeat domain-containing protein [Candidatus Saganbacteria bacterium]|nr:HEAT repeat domain-containing protein [Candidatus Saganbacteria bacterium]